MYVQNNARRTAERKADGILISHLLMLSINKSANRIFYLVVLIDEDSIESESSYLNERSTTSVLFEWY